MYNNNLKATVEANKLAISALQLQFKTVAADCDSFEQDLETRFNIFLSGANIPEKMQRSLAAHITSSHIRVGWSDYSDKTRSNSLDIYYYGPKSWENHGKEENHKWNISGSGNRLIINSADSANTDESRENLDNIRLQLALHDFIGTNKEEFIKFHNDYAANRSKSGDLRFAIEKLERAIRETEEQMEYNTNVRLFKPAGELSSIIKGKDIKFPEGACYRASKRNHIYFDAVSLERESSKRGIRVEFIRYSDAVQENGERQRWVTDAKWLTLQNLVSLHREAKRAYEYKYGKGSYQS